MQPLFENKKGLITGVFNKQSIAWAIAERILDEGGTCGFSYMPDKPDDERKKNLGRVTKLTEGNPRAAFLYPMDVTNDEQIAELMKAAHTKLGKLDFLLHSIAFALPDDLKGDTIDTSRAGFKLAMEISAYSLIALAKASRDFCASPPCQSTASVRLRARPSCRKKVWPDTVSVSPTPHSGGVRHSNPSACPSGRRSASPSPISWRRKSE